MDQNDRTESENLFGRKPATNPSDARLPHQGDEVVVVDVAPTTGSAQPAAAGGRVGSTADPAPAPRLL